MKMGLVKVEMTAKPSPSKDSLNWKLLPKYFNENLDY